MIFNEDGIAYPDYQKTTARIFRDPGRHDLTQWNHIKKIIKSSRVCLDFGGHVGTSAMRFSKVFDRVISFEPVPDLFECLQHNTKELENIEIHNLAIGDECKDVTIYINPENPGSNVVESKATKDIIDSRWKNELRQNFVEQKPIQVKSVSIDSLELHTVDFIKMDTEGYNIEPVIGMKATLERCSPVIMIERGDPYDKKPETILKSWGYRRAKTIAIDDIFVRKE